MTTPKSTLRELQALKAELLEKVEKLESKVQEEMPEVVFLIGASQKQRDSGLASDIAFAVQQALPDGIDSRVFMIGDNRSIGERTLTDLIDQDPTALLPQTNSLAASLAEVPNMDNRPRSVIVVSDGYLSGLDSIEAQDFVSDILTSAQKQTTVDFVDVGRPEGFSDLKQLAQLAKSPSVGFQLVDKNDALLAQKLEQVLKGTVVSRLGPDAYEQPAGKPARVAVLGL